jgi:glutamine amidotransferase
MGNMGAVLNTLSRIGIDARVSSDLSDIKAAEKLIIPGVGAFDKGMGNLEERHIVSLLNKRVLEDKIPVLGICLGLQLMSKMSEEGTLRGLGWLEADTKLFRFNNTKSNVKVPHMGWGTIKIKRKNALFNNIGNDSKFYFLHSYHIVCNNDKDVLATATYGYEFVCAVKKDNIFGVQFHPEKSHKAGIEVLKNFARI